MNIGVDVGPTNTDAAALDDAGAVLATVKVASVQGDPVAGVVAALTALGSAGATRIAVGLRGAATAVAERAGLCRVAALRIGGPSAQAVRPFFGWPVDLREAVEAGAGIVDGGGGLGPEHRTPLDRQAVARFAARVAGRAEAVAVTGVFSPIDGDQEREAAEIVHAELGPLPVSLSADLGSLGLIERENATILDAALSRFALDTAERLALALPGAAVFVTRGDGTLMSLEYLARHPGLSLGSGPASTLRGAGVLTGLRDAVVADVGASRIRVGALAGGFPEETTRGADIGGVPVGFRIPELIRVPRGSAGDRAPGAPLRDRAQAAAGRGAGSGGLTELAEAVDRLQPGVDRLPVVMVGGGAPAVPDGLLGVPDVRRPEHGRTAGAIGAATSPVGGQYERIVRLEGRTRLAEALDAVAEEARAHAVRAGADPRHVEIVETGSSPLAYLPGPFLRLRARAAGPPSRL
ncbi:hydantoinase/oxoprolinase N-terminal domain-containing protein [Streptosporangium roseum]|uniref:Hydantoinase n=1 Tax=Streptosporangium roseum (strain ATCC 12428 / DSM 43021 / JCM 3005 / KCTC 9067 / NCIMB 10171 / NRRL 2505 / NI 9100) TaxID=479432 RepID=D2BEU6_STRRD|nr:hydantoinase/oxoprolinase N-terminal domain-containing protein [Streptosporangium roseum]ACZ86307.1 hydantoinase [Streptosporangium roseum DSM 43021]